MGVVLSTFESARYWAGQKLLHSPFHPLYLKIVGKDKKPPTYERYLLQETQGPALELDTTRYRLVLDPGVQVSPDAAYWLMREAERTGAARVYADEDQINLSIGRHSPVFRPSWSPELAAHCDYVGGCYLERVKRVAGADYARVPRVLFHRTSPPVFRTVSTPQSAPKPALCSVIVCSRSAKLLDSCLHALPARDNLEIVAVLHIGQGQDDALRQVARAHGAKALEFADPFHFGRMCNLAESQRATGDFLLFLNDDVTGLEDRWLDLMLSQAQRPDVGAVGALLYFPDGRLQHAGVMIGTANGAGHPGRLSKGSEIWPWLTMTREVSAVTGACLLMPRTVFRQLGGFDEIFPVNYNDVDLCLRAREAGYRVIQESRARLEHAESATRKTGIRYGERQEFLTRWERVLAKGDPYFNPNLTDDEMLLPDPEAFQRIEDRDGS